MSVAYFTRVPHISPEQARQVITQVGQSLGNKRPDGALYHAEGPTEDGGWWAINVWETDDDARRFAETYLHPVLNELHVPIPTEDRLAVEWETSSMTVHGA